MANGRDGDRRGLRAAAGRPPSSFYSSLPPSLFFPPAAAGALSHGDRRSRVPPAGPRGNGNEAHAASIRAYRSKIKAELSSASAEASSRCSTPTSSRPQALPRPNDGPGSDYEDDGGPEQRRASHFPSSSLSSMIEAARQQEEDLRREIKLLLTPEEKAILDQHETPDVTRISSPKWHPLHSYALALQIPLMDKLLSSGVDINLLDKVMDMFFGYIACDGNDLSCTLRI